MYAISGFFHSENGNSQQIGLVNLVYKGYNKIVLGPFYYTNPCFVTIV